MILLLKDVRSLCASTQNENMMDRPQGSETLPTDNKKTHRLYPSLPNIDR